MTEQVRYKMSETAPTVYLFPDENGVVKAKKVSGCPFGYTSDTPKEEINHNFFVPPQIMKQLEDVKAEDKTEL